MCDAFCSPKFFKCAKYLAQKIYNAHAIFRQFSDVINGGQSQQPSALWLPVNPNALELADQRKANVVF